MSTIGGTTAAAFNLAGSIVGSSRPEAVADQNRASSAIQRTQNDIDAALGESLDDVADAEFSTERDADGRQLYQRRTPPEESAAEAPADGTGTDATVTDATVTRGPLATPIHAADAFGDRGNALDIDA
jgi:hypothetical protein